MSATLQLVFNNAPEDEWSHLLSNRMRSSAYKEIRDVIRDTFCYKDATNRKKLTASVSHMNHQRRCKQLRNLCDPWTHQLTAVQRFHSYPLPLTSGSTTVNCTWLWDSKGQSPAHREMFQWKAPESLQDKAPIVSNSCFIPSADHWCVQGHFSQSCYSFIWPFHRGCCELTALQLHWDFCQWNRKTFLCTSVVHISYILYVPRIISGCKAVSVEHWERKWF